MDWKKSSSPKKIILRLDTGVACVGVGGRRKFGSHSLLLRACNFFSAAFWLFAAKRSRLGKSGAPEALTFSVVSGATGLFFSLAGAAMEQNVCVGL